MEQQEKRKRTASPIRTYFGRELSELRDQFLFTNRELIGEGTFSPTTEDYLSVLSRRFDAISRRTPEAIDSFIDVVASAITSLQERKRELRLQSNFKERIKEKLRIALERDKQIYRNLPAAISIAIRLSQLTGRSIDQLKLDLDDLDNGSLDKVFQLWKGDETN